MKTILDFVKSEPAILVSVILGALNIFTSPSGTQVEAVRTIVESLVILLGGTVVRANVTPMSKVRSGTLPR